MTIRTERKQNKDGIKSSTFILFILQDYEVLILFGAKLIDLSRSLAWPWQENAYIASFETMH